MAKAKQPAKKQASAKGASQPPMQKYPGKVLYWIADDAETKHEGCRLSFVPVKISPEGVAIRCRIDRNFRFKIWQCPESFPDGKAPEYHPASMRSACIGTIDGVTNVYETSPVIREVRAPLMAQVVGREDNWKNMKEPDCARSCELEIVINTIGVSDRSIYHAVWGLVDAMLDSDEKYVCVKNGFCDQSAE